MRWRKLGRDVGASWGRMLVATLALALALAGVGSVLAARAVLAPAMRHSYQATRPAEATLVVPGGVDEALLAAVRAHPEVAEADRRQMVQARVRARPDQPWQPMVLYVAADFAALRLNLFRAEAGAWPPPRGAILVERTAAPVLGIAGGDGGSGGGPRLILQTPHGAPRQVPIAGTVYDGGQAPSWQERRGYGYITLETLAALGEPPLLRELLVQFRPTPQSTAAASQAAARLAGWLTARGHRVDEVRVPRLGHHPHGGLMTGVQLVLLVFSLLLLVLAAIVLATMLSALLARQTRELAVMKVLGARTGQLVVLYGGFVLTLGAAALLLAAPLAYLGGRGMIDGVVRMMNLTPASSEIPPWVAAAWIALGLGVPLLFAMAPILRAAGGTVRRSLAAHGAGDFVRPRLARLPLPLRNALRRPVRLAFAMTLLVTAGALVMAAANAERSLAAISAKLPEARRFDVEIRLHEATAAARLPDLARGSGVRTVEAWRAAAAAVVRPGATFDLVGTYPDGGHGASLLMAPPPGSTALRLPVRHGRWLTAADDRADSDAIVLGHGHPAAAAPLGARLTLSIAGVRSTWTVVGVVEEIGGASAFVGEAAFRRATGEDGVRLLRITTEARDRGERAAILAELERRLAAAGVAVQYAMPALLFRTIIDAHIELVVRAVIAMAAILALVGFFGLGSVMAVGVAERTREIGVMKALGARAGRVLWTFLAEALAIGAASAVLAAALALPLTSLINAQIAAAGIIAPPSFAVSPAALVAWPLAALVGSALASLVPAWRAARMPVRAALAEV